MFIVLCVKAPLQLSNPHRFSHLLYDNLNEDTGRRCRLVFVKMNDMHDTPGHRIRVNKVCE